MTSIDALLELPDVVRLRAALAARPGVRIATEDASKRLAAIALVLRPGEGDGPMADPELLMIKRAEAERDPWSGHVACPGGRMEPGDHDLEQTAVRETWEETGVDLSRAERLGTLDDLHPRTPTLPPVVVRPFVFALASSPPPPLVPSAEVQHAFWLPFARLLAPGVRREATLAVRGVERTFPAYLIGEEMIWGMTERIVTPFLSLLSPTL